MTAKEKAKELVGKFHYEYWNEHNPKEYSLTSVNSALICVEEAENALIDILGNILEAKTRAIIQGKVYCWQETKQEIEKL